MPQFTYAAIITDLRGKRKLFLKKMQFSVKYVTGAESPLQSWCICGMVTLKKFTVAGVFEAAAEICMGGGASKWVMIC